MKKDYKEKILVVIIINISLYFQGLILYNMLNIMTHTLTLSSFIFSLKLIFGINIVTNTLVAVYVGFRKLINYNKN